jgi:hypothetical protein
MSTTIVLGGGVSNVDPWAAGLNDVDVEFTESLWISTAGHQNSESYEDLLLLDNGQTIYFFHSLN